MKYYQDLTLIPQVEINPYFIWSKLYTQLHLALVEMKDEKNRVPIGVSFPEYASSKKDKAHILLGSKLRVFAEDESLLKQLDLPKWLNRLTDYVHHTGIREVPKKVDGYAVYSRYQPQTNVERLARRYAKRKQIPIEEALKHYAEFKDEMTKLPFIRLKSLTSSQPFNLFVKKEPVDKLINHKFSTYGFSQRDNKDKSSPMPSVPEFKF